MAGRSLLSDFVVRVAVSVLCCYCVRAAKLGVYWDVSGECVSVKLYFQHRRHL